MEKLTSKLKPNDSQERCWGLPEASRILAGFLSNWLDIFEGYQCVSSTQGRISQKSRCLKGTSGHLSFTSFPVFQAISPEITTKYWAICVSVCMCVCVPDTVPQVPWIYSIIFFPVQVLLNYYPHLVSEKPRTQESVTCPGSCRGEELSFSFLMYLHDTGVIKFHSRTITRISITGTWHF